MNSGPLGDYSSSRMWGGLQVRVPTSASKGQRKRGCSEVQKGQTSIKKFFFSK